MVVDLPAAAGVGDGNVVGQSAAHAAGVVDAEELVGLYCYPKEFVTWDSLQSSGAKDIEDLGVVQVRHEVPPCFQVQPRTGDSLRQSGGPTAVQEFVVDSCPDVDRHGEIFRRESPRTAPRSILLDDA
jgi:hypothetical protein